MTFLKNLSSRRQVSVEPAQAPKAGQAPKRAAASAEAFASAQISEKLVSKYGSTLKPVAPEMNAIGQVALAMRAHRADQFSRSLDRYYGDLGKLLERLPEAERAGSARVAVGALAKIVDRIGTGERLVPAIETLSSLLFFPKPDGRSLPLLAERAVAGLEQLLLALEGRVGASTTLFGFRNLSEVATKNLPGLDLDERSAIWNEVVKFLLEGGPASGMSQGELGKLVGLYFEAARKEPAPRKALATALAAAQAPFAAALEATRGQLKVPPPLGEEAPGRIAYGAIADALDGLLERHRAGPPSLLEAVERLADRVLALAPGVAAEQLEGYQAIARIIRATAGQAPAERVINYLADTIQALFLNPPAVAPLLDVQGLAEVPRALLRSRGAQLGQQGNELDEALKVIERLAPSTGVATALAILPHLAGHDPGALALSTAEFARTAEATEQLARFATSFASAQPTLAGQLGPERGRALAMALAADLDGKEDPARAQFIAWAAVLVAAQLPNIEVGKLANSDRLGEAGLLTLVAQNPQGRAPLDYAIRMIQTLAGAGVPEDTQLALARRALYVGNELSRLDRDPETVMPRVLEDWAATLADPAQLHPALKPGKSAGVKGLGQGTALGFLEAHAELPPELTLTAGRHLNSEQMSWLSASIQNERSHGKVRQWRDLVFGLVQAGRLDLLEAMRTSPSGRKAIDACLGYVVQEYRVGRVANLPFDRLKEGLVAGTDPVAEILAAQNAGAMGALQAGDGAGPGAAEAAATLQRLDATVKAFLAFFPDGQQVWNLPSETFKKPLMDWLKAYAEGRVTEYKYGNPVAVKQLARLTPEQRELWATEELTALAAPVPAPDGPETEQSKQLLRGLLPALDRVQLSSKAWPQLKFDAPSQARLAEARDRLLVELRQVAKGSAEHRAASKAIGPIIDRLSLIELKLALDEVAAAPAQPLATSLAGLKGLLAPAARAIRRFGGAEIAEVLTELGQGIKEVKGQKRSGLFAADEDRLDAYLTSFGGGSCIDPVHGFNRPCIVEKMASGRYKMCRAMNDEQPQARAFLRLMDIEVGAYQGYALWLDAPQATPGGNCGADQQKLMYRHAFNKAMRMGVPFFCAGGLVAEVAHERGLVPEQLDVTVVLDRGVTGNHHTQYLAPIGPYGVRWPDSTWDYGHQVAPGLEEPHRMNAVVSVVFPPGVEH